MRYLISTIVLIAWGLWFGGLLALFVSVTALFASDRTLAIQTAPRIFVAFGMYQLIVAGLAIAATFVWQIIAPSRWVLWLFILFGLSAVAPVILATLIVPRMEEIRRTGDTSSPEFRQLHAKSMTVYVAETSALLAAAVILPMAIGSSLKQAMARADHAESSARASSGGTGAP